MSASGDGHAPRERVRYLVFSVSLREDSLNTKLARLGEFDRPALIAWSLDDRFFKPAHAQQLARELPNARLEWIENARSFSPEDEPARLAELIAGFVRELG